LWDDSGHRTAIDDYGTVPANPGGGGADNPNIRKAAVVYLYAFPYLVNGMKNMKAGEFEDDFKLKIMKFDV
jgi:hypothetical protein